MVVLATNRPGDLDDAVLDRMDEAILFDLPGQEQRAQLLGLYLDKYIRKAGTAEVGAACFECVGFAASDDCWLWRLCCI
jgi:ATPase family AAA domain-containing protein 3A/B